jgi:ABC-type glycerol-3-phosphate transport system substrate-binding protein
MNQQPFPQDSYQPTQPQLPPIYDPTTDPMLHPQQNQPRFVSRRARVTMLGITIALIVAVIGGVIFYVYTLTSKSGVDSNTVAARCPKDSKLTWWVPDVAYMDKSAFKGVFDAYKKKFPGLNLTIEMVNRKYDPYDYYNDILTAMAKDASPDIFAVRNDDLPAYSEFAAPILAFNSVAIDNYKRDFVDIVGAETVYKDQLYGVATYVDNLQMYYNKQILDQNKISKPAVTWQDIVAQTKLLTKQKPGQGFDQSVVSLGLGTTLVRDAGVDKIQQNIRDSQDIIPTLIAQYGGVIYDQPTNTVGFQFDASSGGKSDNAFKKAIDFYYSFADDRQSGNTYTWDRFQGNNLDEFTQNRLIYMFGYKELDAVIAAKRQGLDYQIAPIPQQNPDQKRTAGRYFMNMMSRKLAPFETGTAPAKIATGKRACAESMLTFLATYEAQKLYADATQMPGAHREVIKSQVNGNQTSKIFAEGALYAVSYFKPDVLAVERVWNEMMEKISANYGLEKSIGEAASAYASITGAAPKIRVRQEQ